jgi:hypothetical protein
MVPLGGGDQQPPHLKDGQRDLPGVRRRCLVRSLGIGAVPKLGGGDCADSQGAHHQHYEAEDRGVQPDLVLVQAEAVLARPAVLFNWLCRPNTRLND